MISGCSWFFKETSSAMQRVCSEKGELFQTNGPFLIFSERFVYCFWSFQVGCLDKPKKTNKEPKGFFPLSRGINEASEEKAHLPTVDWEGRVMEHFGVLKLVAMGQKENPWGPQVLVYFSFLQYLRYPFRSTP